MVDIAIVGIGCRFPGGVFDPESYWNFLLGKGDGIVDIPPDRWSVEKYYDPDPDAPGRMYTRRGGFLTQPLWDFDADFFGIAQKEAAILDPQQRLLLEVTWEALDDAGMAGRVSGHRVGVYVGGFILDNVLGRSGPLVRSAITSHTAMSASHTLLSNRISYLLDLHGPSLTVDTACSSSLVATHLAVQAIANGECEIALAGGANAMLQPETFISMCKGRFLSVDGRCKTFDAAADGYGRAEGAGAVLLKPLDLAQRDNDRVYAVIRATGVNQDGRTMAIPVPNPVAQEQLARQVRDDAGVAAHEVSYLEAHGTGTAVGDPIELAALGAVYGAVDGRGEPVPVGSVKNNFGHTEAAAGVASLIKAALTLHHRTVAPQFELKTPNPEIEFDELRLRVPLQPEPLPAAPGKGVVAVNGFGYGGTNAHVILVEAPPRAARTEDERPVPKVLPISGRHETAVRALADELAHALDRHPADAVTAAAWTRRAHHPLRVGFAYDDADDLRAQLRAFAAGEGRAPSRLIGDGEVEPVFVFSGMGPQWWGMGRELLTTDSTFAKVAREIDREFVSIAGWSILDEMLADEAGSRIMRTAYAQPANFVLQAALTAELAEYGVYPAVVVGHSVGEVTAAYVSGALSLRDALTVSYHRARLQATTAGTGGMLALGMSENEARELLARTDSISIAAVNSPGAVTLAGDSGDLELLRDTLSATGTFARSLRVEVPYHSHLMDPILDDLRAALSRLAPRDAKLTTYSTVTAAEIAGTEWDADYWCRNVREPVRFADAIGALVDAGHRVFLEVGPHPVLSGNIREILIHRGVIGAVVTTLSRDLRDRNNVLRAVADLYVAGSLDGSTVPGRPDSVVEHLDLPAYPWQRKRVWHDEPVTLLDRLGTPDGYALLGDRTAAANSEWEVQLSVSRLPWLRDHVVDGHVVLPGAAYLDAALSAAVERTGRTSVGLESVEFVAPLVIDEHDVPVLRVNVEESTKRFQIRSRPATAATWTLNAHGRLIEADFAAAAVEVEAPEHAAAVAGPDLYRGLAARGLDYGPAFQRIVSAVVGADAVVAALAPVEEPAPVRHLAHPAVVDAALQCVAALAADTDTGVAIVPAAIAGVRRLGPLPERPRVVVTRRGVDPLRADIAVVGENGEVAMRLLGVEFRPVSATVDATHQLERVFYQPIWEIVEAPSGARPAEAELVVAVCVGADAADRAITLLGDRADRTVVLADPDADDDERLRLALRSPDGEPIGERIRVVSVFGAAFDAARNVYWLARVANAIEHLLADAPHVHVRGIVVTENALCTPADSTAQVAHGALVGARRALLNEQPAAGWRLVDADRQATTLADLVLTDDVLDEIGVRGADHWAVRLDRNFGTHLEQRNRAAPLPEPEASFAVEIPKSRLMSDLALRETERIAPGPGEIEVRMEAAGLNYKDAMKVIGVLTGQELTGTYFGTTVGMEGSGVVERVGPGVTGVAVGDRMMVCARDILRKYVTMPVDAGATMPHGLLPGADYDPLTCGSGLPFLTAEFGLRTLARLRAGETVLVHGAAGGMGMAAVQVALDIGATVIATAGTPERRAQVRGLGAQHVLNSRSADFVDEIASLTGGRGVDVVYSSAPGEILRQNFRVAAEFGRVVDIGKADIYTGGVIDLEPFDRNLTFFSVDMDRALAHDPELLRVPMRASHAALRAGRYQYLPYTAYPVSELAAAFESVARSDQIGRVVLDLREVCPMVRPAIGYPRIDPDGCYLVTGGFGGFGAATARWLVAEGARKLVLVGRSGAATPQARDQVAAFTAAGVTVIEERVDVADYAATAALVDRIRSVGPLRGVFHAAGVVNNLPVPQITRESLDELFAKVRGAQHLDRAVEAAGIELDMFVLYSSISALGCITPQVGYAAANAALDALAAQRRARGAAALAVNWGFMSGGGMADKTEALVDYVKSIGFLPIDMDRATALLRECLTLDSAQVVVADIDWTVWSRVTRPSTDTRRFRQLLADIGVTGEAGGTLRAEILTLPTEQRADFVAQRLADQLAVVLGVDTEAINIDEPVTDLGMDSLMAMEFGARTEKELDVKISALELSRGLSLRGIGAKVVTQFAEPADAQAAA
ncbi:SDR family NAD(P)-dependent oxidoreductase [Nocardia beijingensis]|uniref:type I polyketide synthase n=1 Tax=Nocardia beijingensis TaxID=95162 RepID=UPI001895D3A4|nr:type I polyketide synthase [Nocardia beijingensis]MBF6468391.1 SDR family NAD(P)-dependent oxidoreductase [Nocardia beijingensis]